MHIPNPALQAIHEKSSHPAASPQLVKAANEFEASFLGELLKPLREDPLFGDGSGLGGDSLDNGGSGGSMGTVSSLASEAFAQAIAKQGGLGIARLALAELAPAEAAESKAASLLTGSECGGCADTHLEMGTGDTSSLESEAVEMLGQGSLQEPVRNAGGERKAINKFQKGVAMTDGGDTMQPVASVRAIERITK